MGLNLNQVIIAGNLTRDPEIRSLAEGKMVCVFTIANNRKWKGQDGTLHEEATFIDCEAWARTAEMVGQYLTKGSSCIVLGRLKQDSWTDKESGGKRSKLKVVVENVQFIGGRPNRGEGGEGAETSGDAMEETATVAATAEPKRAQRPMARDGGQSYRPAATRNGTAVLDEPPF